MIRCGLFLSSAIDIAPEPIPISRPVILLFSGILFRTSSTRSSVSGLGIKTPSSIFSFTLKNSFSPKIYPRGYLSALFSIREKNFRFSSVVRYLSFSVINFQRGIFKTFDRIRCVSVIGVFIPASLSLFTPCSIASLIFIFFGLIILLNTVCLAYLSLPDGLYPDT